MGRLVRLHLLLRLSKQWGWRVRAASCGGDRGACSQLVTMDTRRVVWRARVMRGSTNCNCTLLAIWLQISSARQWYSSTVHGNTPIWTSPRPIQAREFHMPQAIMTNILPAMLSTSKFHVSLWFSIFATYDDLFRTAARPWVTSGMYPQFIVITFPKMMSIRSVDLKTCQGNKICWKFDCSRADHVNNAIFRSSWGFCWKKHQRVECNSVFSSDVRRLQNSRGKYAGTGDKI